MCPLSDHQLPSLNPIFQIIKTTAGDQSSAVFGIVLAKSVNPEDISVSTRVEEVDPTTTLPNRSIDAMVDQVVGSIDDQIIIKIDLKVCL